MHANSSSNVTDVTPLGVNHVVLNVRDIEQSHRFWTEVVGLKQVGALRPRPGASAMALEDDIENAPRFGPAGA